MQQKRVKVRRAKKKFKGLLCFDVASGVSPGVCECVQNAANAFSHLQYGDMDYGGTNLFT